MAQLSGLLAAYQAVLDDDRYEEVRQPVAAEEMVAARASTALALVSPPDASGAAPPPLFSPPLLSPPLLSPPLLPSGMPADGSGSHAAPQDASPFDVEEDAVLLVETELQGSPTDEAAAVLGTTTLLLTCSVTEEAVGVHPPGAAVASAPSSAGAGAGAPGPVSALAATFGQPATLVLAPGAGLVRDDTHLPTAVALATSSSLLPSPPPSASLLPSPTARSPSHLPRAGAQRFAPRDPKEAEALLRSMSARALARDKGRLARVAGGAASQAASRKRAADAGEGGSAGAGAQGSPGPKRPRKPTPRALEAAAGMLADDEVAAAVAELDEEMEVEVEVDDEVEVEVNLGAESDDEVIEVDADSDDGEAHIAAAEPTAVLLSEERLWSDAVV